MKKIYVALPAYSGTVRVETMQALLEAQLDCLTHGWTMAVRIGVGDAILPRSRNLFVADFLLQEDFTDLVFIDHDLQWEAGAFSKLLSHDEDFVLGVYPNREDPLRFPVRWLENKEPDERGLVEIMVGPAGFMRLTRRCLQGMVDRYWSLAFNAEQLSSGVAWALFDFTKVGMNYWGEDFTFCHRWREMGGKVWADPSITFVHHGNKGFIGCLSDTMEKPANVIPIKQTGE